MALSWDDRCGPNSSKKASRVLASRPLAPQTTLPRSWSTTSVRYLGLAPGDLVHPDAEQTVEAMVVQFARHHPFAGPSHCPPRHPAQAGDRGLVHPRGQPRQQVVEVPGQVRPRPGEGNGLHHHAVIGAAQTTQLGPDLEPPRPQVEMTPARRRRSGVVAEAGSCTRSGSTQPSPAQGYGDDHDRGQELHGDDVD